jgi:hypothetical protein
MVFPIAGGNESKGYEISNSLRFNDDDSAKLQRTPSSDGNKRVWTISTWLKRSKLGALQTFFGAGSSTPDTLIKLTPDDEFEISRYHGGYTWQVTSSNKLRDPSAWYHLVGAVDTTQGTASNRVKLYINGVQVSSFTNSSYPSENFDTELNDTSRPTKLGTHPGDTQYYDGYMTETHFVDGSQLAPTDFGEFDDNGVWVPIKYTGTYGTNGFFMEFQQTGTSANSSGIGADTSGNDNHFTPTNLAATDITEDTCTNNFCTWNPLDTHSGNTFSEGNLKVNGAGSARLCSTTFAPSQGKWYQEFKLTDVNSGSIYNVEQGALALSGNLFVSGSDNTGIYFSGPNVYRNGSNQGDITGGFSDDDILQIALDLDNNNVYYGKNGNWSDGIGGGFDQSDFSNASGFALTRTTSDNNITFSTQNGASGSAFELIANWGNPPYAVSSSNTDGKYGNFEYAVPSGYYALCTKRLAEFG